MRFGVLGAVEVHRDDVPVDLGVPKQRALLAALALAPGKTVSATALVDLLWGDAAPPGALGTLQTYVAGLRRALEPGREARATDGVLATAGNGYALRVAPDAVDAVAFERAVAAARVALGTAAARPPLPRPAAGPRPGALRAGRRPRAVAGRPLSRAR